MPTIHPQHNLKQRETSKELKVDDFSEIKVRSNSITHHHSFKRETTFRSFSPIITVPAKGNRVSYVEIVTNILSP